MRHGVESQGLLEQLSIELQELAGISAARIGDDKADVEIVSGGGELPDEILPGDIKHDDSMLHTVTLAKFNAYFLKQVLPPRHEDNIDSRSCDLLRKFLAYSGRGTRDECPGAEPFFIERDCHLFAPFCLLRACYVCCVINYSFELILRSEHTIDRSAHLFQNKSRRQAIHHFELIRLTWTNFKAIGLHSFDGDFNHVFHLHDGNAFHGFKIKITKEFGLCRRRRQLKIG